MCIEISHCYDIVKISMNIFVYSYRFYSIEKKKERAKEKMFKKKESEKGIAQSIEGEWMDG